MKPIDKLSNRGRFVKAMLTVTHVGIAICAYLISIWFFYKNSYAHLGTFFNSDFLITSVFIALFWTGLDFWLNTNEVYRSRSYGYVVLYHIIENAIGVVMLTFALVVFNLPFYGRDVLLTFGALTTFLAILCKAVFYHMLRRYRRKGYNIKYVVFICDQQCENLLSLINNRFEWGYKIVAIMGDDYIVNKYGATHKVYSLGSDIEKVLTDGEIDEVIYSRRYDSSQEIMYYMEMCQDLGITFRLYSPFLNRISSTTQLRYFDTNAVITITNTPTNYVALLVKRAFDVCFALGVVVIGMPFFLIVALLIKLDSKGPIFFKQQRSGLKGKVFNVYKFRSMYVDAEERKAELMERNEMDGPVFKMTNDPRITRVGRVIRKTGIDEFPQFMNVLLGDMSVVGPRPPLPCEVAEYERWQRRRLAMRPGITCLWQTSPNRNEVSFDEWMRLDMEYIDNWSLTLDVVIFFKTVRGMFRADGK